MKPSNEHGRKPGDGAVPLSRFDAIFDADRPDRSRGALGDGPERPASDERRRDDARRVSDLLGSLVTKGSLEVERLRSLATALEQIAELAQGDDESPDLAAGEAGLARAVVDRAEAFDPIAELAHDELGLEPGEQVPPLDLARFRHKLRVEALKEASDAAGETARALEVAEGRDQLEHICSQQVRPELLAALSVGRFPDDVAAEVRDRVESTSHVLPSSPLVHDDGPDVCDPFDGREGGEAVDEVVQFSTRVAAVGALNAAPELEGMTPDEKLALAATVFESDFARWVESGFESSGIPAGMLRERPDLIPAPTFVIHDAAALSSLQAILSQPLTLDAMKTDVAELGILFRLARRETGFLCDASGAAVELVILRSPDSLLRQKISELERARGKGGFADALEWFPRVESIAFDLFAAKPTIVK